MSLEAATAAFMKKIQEQNRATQPVSVMRPEITQMKDLIGNLGFRLMGASNLVYDNTAISLRWRMGSGAKFEQVIFTYDEGLDLYKLRFINYGGPGRGEIVEDMTIDMLHVEDVKGAIERNTGFYLSFR